jgi:shikimate dehydrogenase
MDFIYNPRKTQLINMAEKYCKKVVGGMAMLIYQAVSAQEIWHGFKFAREDIKNIGKL